MVEIAHPDGLFKTGTLLPDSNIVSPLWFFPPTARKNTGQLGSCLSFPSESETLQHLQLPSGRALLTLIPQEF